MPFEVIPAVDIRGGKCVRLYQGDFAKETVFSDDPVAIVKKWQSLGARRLHVVDLDGAATGQPANLQVIKKITSTVSIPVQVGGGLRRIETVEQLLKLGTDRVVLGTAAIEDPALVEEAFHRFGHAIVVGVDARNGYVSTHGWTSDAEITSTQLLRRMTSLGIRRFVYTDISRDGTLTEPNFEAIGQVITDTRAKVIASGGVSSIEHLQKLGLLGAEGAIVGRALYTGDLDLAEAVRQSGRWKPKAGA